MAIIDENLSQEARISEDIDLPFLAGYNGQVNDYLPEGVTRRSESVLGFEKDAALKYCVVASLVLHVALFSWLIRAIDLDSSKAVTKPRPSVTTVRLVEPQPPQKEPEPPPKQASAISNRNHIAKKPRLPKQIPQPKPVARPKAPIGRIAPQEQRLAALSPPMAPEDLVKPEPEKAKKTERNRPKKAKKPATKRPEKPRTLASRSRPRDVRDLDVDLNPTRQEIATALAPNSGSTDFFHEGDQDEVVVDINTRENRFFSYLLYLKKKIQGVWVYPSTAARAGIGGALTLEFSVAKDGRLLFVNLLDSSGHTILDQSAMSAIKSAAPYFPIPARLKAKKLRIRANFNYVTENFFRRIL